MDNPEPQPKAASDIWTDLRMLKTARKKPEIKNANAMSDDKMSKLDRLAIFITDHVGTMGFFLIIFGWTVLWCGYNILASEIPALGWKAFDPFPAFVAYLLISNVIQILLMPLIMVGQNLQGRHSEIRAELDFEINQTAEKEVTLIIQHLEHNTDLLIQLMKHMDCNISRDMIRILHQEKEIAESIAETKKANLEQ